MERRIFQSKFIRLDFNIYQVIVVYALYAKYLCIYLFIIVKIRHGDDMGLLFHDIILLSLAPMH